MPAFQITVKQKQVNARKAGPKVGDSWTYIAVDRNNKMILAYHVGQYTDIFLRKLADNVDRSNRIHVLTDGLNGYQYGVPFAMGSNIDLVPMFGHPDEDRICTSHIESLNQKIRMHLRRFTRLTAARSKSIDHHIAMQNTFFAVQLLSQAFYNRKDASGGPRNCTSSVFRFASLKGDNLNPYDPPELSEPPKLDAEDSMTWLKAFSTGGIWFALLIVSPIVLAFLWSLVSVSWELLTG